MDHNQFHRPDSVKITLLRNIAFGKAAFSFTFTFLAFGRCSYPDSLTFSSFIELSS